MTPGRIGGVLTAVACIVLGLPATAAASTAGFAATGAFSFTAAAGERNDVTVESGVAGFRIRDAGNVVTPGPGCVPVGLDAVECMLPPTAFANCGLGDCDATVDLGDGDDTALVPFRLASSTTVLGGPGDDRLEGGTDTLNLVGGDGADALIGSAESDALSGGAGKDLLDGRGGVDVASYAERTAPVDVSLDGRGNDGAAGEFDDVRTEVVVGGGGDDALTGGTGDDLLYGGGGTDLLVGGAGNDLLDGGDVDPSVADPGDTLRCGDGDDVAPLRPADSATLDCEVAGRGPLLSRLVQIEARTVRATRSGAVRLALRRVPPSPAAGYADPPTTLTGTLLLRDGRGRALGRPVRFSLAPDARGSVVVKLPPAERRRLARARRLEVHGVRDIALKLSDTVTSTTRIAGRVTLLAPKRRR